jgi:hypothetical protein
VRCHRGCTASEITAAIGLDLRALFATRTAGERRENVELPRNSRDVERLVIAEASLIARREAEAFE